MQMYHNIEWIGPAYPAGTKKDAFLALLCPNVLHGRTRLHLLPNAICWAVGGHDEEGRGEFVLSVKAHETLTTGCNQEAGEGKQNLSYNHPGRY
jgi:hypothetical protein